MTDTVDDFLVHFGIKGMRWGVRRHYEFGDTERTIRQSRKSRRAAAQTEENREPRFQVSRKTAAIGATAGVAVLAAGVTTAGLILRNKAKVTVPKLPKQNPDVEDIVQEFKDFKFSYKTPKLPEPQDFAVQKNAQLDTIKKIKDAWKNPDFKWEL